MKHIEVVAAIICRGDQIFATQRGYGEWKDWWEFPGEISVDRFVMTVEHDYPAFHLTMHCYVCHVLSGHLELLEAEDARWLREDNLSGVRWLPADRQVVDNLRATHLLDK